MPGTREGRVSRVAISGLVALALAGCGTGSQASGTPGTSAAVSVAPTILPTVTLASNLSGTVESGGKSRAYLLHLPPTSTRLKPTPIVVAFHGWPMTAERIAEITHLSAVADEHGFAVLFPQGYGQSWSVPGGLATPAHEAGIDDVAFTRDLLDSVAPTNELDASHVVASGISNGGHLVEALGCALTDHLVGIVPVAAPLRGDSTSECKPSRSLSVLEIVGSDDLSAASFPDTLAFWAHADQCPSAAASSSLPDVAHDLTTVTIRSFTDCLGGTEVTGYFVAGGGHAWPGGLSVGSVDEFGITSQQFDASELIWAFLSRHL